MEEVWKDVDGYEELYQISNLGRVRRLKGYCQLDNNKRRYRAYVYVNRKKISIGTYETKQQAKVARDIYVNMHPECYWYQIINPHVVRDYYSVSLSKDCVCKHYYIHRLVAKAFIPNPNNYPVVNHRDYNKLNNRVDNLEWCTQEFNVRHSSEYMKIPKTKDIRQKFEKYIRKKGDKYELCIRLNGYRYYKRFQDLNQAIEQRDDILRSLGYV